MFAVPPVPDDKLQTRYIAPFGLTALLHPGEPGQPVESFWIGGQGNAGIVFFVSALDAEIFRLHSLSIGDEWVRKPLENLGFQQTVATLGHAYTNIVYGFDANVRGELCLGSSGCLLLPHFQECFGPLQHPSAPVTFRFAPGLFKAMQKQWQFTGEPDYANIVAKMNALGTTRAGAVQLKEIAEKALRLIKIAPPDKTGHELVDLTIFDPDTLQWRYGPSQARQHLH